MSRAEMIVVGECQHPELAEARIGSIERLMDGTRFKKICDFWMNVLKVRHTEGEASDFIY